MAESPSLSEWYHGLFFRTVDLVGDYAGEEIFIIEGDSLLLHAFCDPVLDFSSGLQLLHAVWLVEIYLKALYSRKCRFNVVFFDDHESVSIPPKVPQSEHFRYQLARAAIIQHLKQNVPSSASEIEIHEFDSVRSDAFIKYLDTVGAYFVMAHDGARMGDTQIQTLRRMILWFTARGYNISLINGTEFRDTKVMAMVAEGSAKRAIQLEQKLLPEQQQTNGKGSNNVAYASIDQAKDILKPSNPTQRLSQRRILTLATLTSMKGDKEPKDALLMHLAILETASIEERGKISSSQSKTAAAIPSKFCNTALSLLRSDQWHKSIDQATTDCDLGDFFDGRLYAGALRDLSASKVSSWTTQTIKQTFNELVSLLNQLDSSSSNIQPQEVISSSESQPSKKSKSSRLELEILPFNNSVFDKHLDPVQIQVSNAAEEPPTEVTDRIFSELSHWHNSKAPVDPKAITPLTQWQKERALKRNQWYMTEIRDFAASLTNAAGGILEPETVIVGSNAKSEKPVSESLKKSKGQSSSTKASGGNKASGGKPATKNAGGKNGKLSTKEMAAKTRQQDAQNQKAKDMSALGVKLKEFEAEKDPAIRYWKSNQYLTSSSKDKRISLEPNIRAYQLTCLLNIYAGLSGQDMEQERLSIAAVMLSTLGTLEKLKQGLSKDIIAYAEKIISLFNFPEMNFKVQDEATMKAIEYPLSKIERLDMDSKEFQLVHGGPYLSRNMGSAPDERVRDFEPDAWQRKVLDVIDARQSLLVVAPTSAGKTFISFYAMKQIIEADDDGVLIYVAPTKALVNQIAAEVQARFKKNFKYPAGKSVWAIHTRDHRVNNPTGCQVLVTVPHILQIMLLAPSNANSWSKRVRRIIFDEVHCIGQAEDGIVWEQLLLMSPCPVIALSATVGNPGEFHSWLNSAQKANDMDVALIQHPHRYSDLRKYIYNPPKTFTFRGLSGVTRANPSPLGLESAQSMAFMHPVSSIINRSRGMPDDLTLEARDCWLLWKAMKKFATPQYPIDDRLDPAKALPSRVKKLDVVTWETDLKAVLEKWIRDQASPFDKVIQELDHSVDQAQRPESQLSERTPAKADQEKTGSSSIEDPSDLLATTMALACTLHENDALPAIFFNYDRSACEAIGSALLQQLKDAENIWKESSPVWKKKLADFEIWKKVQSKAKPAKAASQKKSAPQGADGELSKSNALRDAAETERSPFDTFSPEDKVDGFHFADPTTGVGLSDLAEYRKQLEGREVPGWLIDALERGIGIHHAGMNRKYRQVCEMLFRKRYLRIVIATGTLALGINMPCKTVVFSGDSIFLTALNFRQAAGRAGRRGFDLLGNVVFQGVPYAKVCRLLSSRLPDLNGHFPITTTLVLRLFNLLQDSKQSNFAKNTINSILSQPRIYLGGEEARHTVLHHLRFSIEYLRRNYLLGEDGKPINFAGTVSHLYFTENASFGFHALLKAGYFHNLCQQYTQKRDETVLELVLVLSHLFGRRNLPVSQLETIKAAVKGLSGSVVVLPELPGKARKALADHDEQTLGIYTAYVKTFVSQHLDTVADNTLPLTRRKCGTSDDKNADEPSNMVSSFVALSGYTEKDVKSIPDLCSTVRSGVFLEKAVIPYVGIADDPLNAYLYDFFKHGSTKDLECANGIRKGEVWFLLKDFSLILATIVTSFRNFLKLSATADVDAELLEITDAAERHEEAVDDKAAEAEGGIKFGSAETPKALNPIAAQKQQLVAIASRAAPGPAKKTKVTDSWDDNVSDVDSDEESQTLVDDEEIREREKSINGKGNGNKINSEEDESIDFRSEKAGFMQVLAAFEALRTEFDEKFKAMWA